MAGSEAMSWGGMEQLCTPAWKLGIMTLPPQVWSMAIQWWPTTAKGCFESTLSKIEPAPQRLQGWNSRLLAKGPQKILVTWDPPVRTNGHIVNYTLFIRELFERETKMIHINTTHNSFGPQSSTVNQLKPFHRQLTRFTENKPLSLSITWTLGQFQWRPRANVWCPQPSSI